MDLIDVRPETSLCSLQVDAFLSASVSSWMVELSGQDWEVPEETVRELATLLLITAAWLRAGLVSYLLTLTSL